MPQEPRAGRRGGGPESMGTVQARVGGLLSGASYELTPPWPGLLHASPRRAASGPTALFRNTKAAGAAIGGVKNMLLEWCRAMTRNYEVGRGSDPRPGRQGRGGAGWRRARGARRRPLGRTLTEARSGPRSPAARGHPELLLELEQRHGLLRPHPQVLPRRLRLRRAGAHAAPAQLHPGLLHRRVSRSY